MRNLKAVARAVHRNVRLAVRTPVSAAESSDPRDLYFCAVGSVRMDRPNLLHPNVGNHAAGDILASATIPFDREHPRAVLQCVPAFAFIGFRMQFDVSRLDRGRWGKIHFNCGGWAAGDFNLALAE